MNSGLAAVLPWDSEFFGLRIAQVNSDRLTGEALPALRQWLLEERINCAYCRVSAAGAAQLRLLQEFGFRYVDVRVTLARRLDGLHAEQAGGWQVRRAVPDDLPSLQALAAASHRNTRFFADGHFPPERCEELYRIWVEKDLRRPGGAVFTVAAGGVASAYLTCRATSPEQGEIGLFAVGPALQGLGCGQSLLAHGLRWFADSGCQWVRVPTQIANSGAIRSYERAGFCVEGAEVWLHWWSNAAGRST